MLRPLSSRLNGIQVDQGVDLLVSMRKTGEGRYVCISLAVLSFIKWLTSVKEACQNTAAVQKLHADIAQEG